MRRAAFVNINVTGTSNLVGLATLQSGINVTGSATFSNTMIDGDLTVSGLTTFQNVEIINDFNVQDSINFENDVNVWGSFSVSGGTTFANGVYVTDDLSVSGNLAIGGNFSIGTISIENGMNVTGSSSFNDALLLDDTLTVNGGASFNSDVTVASTLVANGVVRATSGLNVTGSASFNDAVLVDDILTVNGALRATSGLNVTGSASFNDDVTVASTLIANGAIRATSGLNVTGSASFNGDLTVNGTFTPSGGLSITNLAVPGTLGVTGSASFQSGILVAGDAVRATSGLNVTGSSSFNSALTVTDVLTANGALNANSTLTVTDVLTANGAVRATSGLNVTGSSSFNSALIANSTLTVTDVLTANGAVRATSGLNVTGSSSFNSDLTVAGALTTSGTLTAVGTLNANTGAVITTGGLQVQGGVLQVQTNGIHVTGAATFNSGLFITGGSLLVANIASAVASSSINIGNDANTSTVNLACGSNIQTVNIGSNNSTGQTTINIGGSGDIVNIAGSMNYISVTNIAVADKTIVLNRNGAASTSNGAGLYFEEAGVENAGMLILRDTAQRDQYQFKTPGNNRNLYTPVISATSTILAQPDAGSGTVTISNNLNVTGSTVLFSGLNVTGNASFNGLVGIGREPATRLDVQQSLAVNDDTAVIRLANAFGSNFIQSGVSYTSGSVAPLIFGSMLGASEWARFSTSGNFGIGTNSPVVKLHVVTGAQTTAELLRMSNGTSTIYSGVDNSSGPWFGTSTNHNLRLVTNAVARMTIDNSGIVRILTGGLNVTGSSSFNSDVIANSTLTVTDVLTANGAVRATSGLNVTGSSSFNSALIANSTLTVTDILTANGAVRATSGLNVTGSSSFNSGLTVSGSAMLGFVGLNVTGSSSFNSGLTVSGAATRLFTGLNVTGSSSFNSGLTVTGGNTILHGGIVGIGATPSAGTLDISGTTSNRVIINLRNVTATGSMNYIYFPNFPASAPTDQYRYRPLIVSNRSGNNYGCFGVGDEPSTGSSVWLGSYFGDTAYPKMVVNDSGNVGIGTTGPTNSLDVNGRTVIRSGLNVTGSSSFNSGLTVIGNVGIGTESPTQNLEIRNGDIAISTTSNDSASNNFAFYKSRLGLQTTGNDELGYISFYGEDSSNAIQRGAYILASQQTLSGSTFVPGSLGFYTRGPNNTESLRMFINMTGNVGVGVANPAQRLDVSGRIRVRGSASDPSSVIELVNNAGNTAFFFLDNSNNFVLGTASSTNIQMATRITTGGLGVTGSVSFNNGLTVSGGANISVGGMNVTGSVSFNNGLIVTGGNIQVSVTGISGNYTSFASLMADNVSSGISLLPSQFIAYSGASSGAATNVLTPIIANAAGADAGGIYIFTGIGQYNMWRTFQHLNRGTYRFWLRFAANTDRGIMSLYIDDVSVGTIDMYFGSSNYGYSSISNISVANTGSHKIEFRVDTTNGLSLGDRYVMVWHYAGFTRTGNVA